MKGVGLSVNGSVYGGWKNISIKRSLKTIAGSFSMSVTNRWPDQKLPWGLLPGEKCVVTIDNDVVITGYIDTVSPSISPTERSISVSGRDLTCDFVDSSADDKHFQNVSLKTVAAFLAKPFGIPIQIIGNVGANFLVFDISTGETAFAALERACRLRGFLVTTDGFGKIIVKRPIATPSNSSIEEGVNLKQGKANYNFTERFSNYAVKGQQYDFNNDLPANLRYRLQGFAKDPAIDRYRYHLSTAEASLTANEANIRAQWEATNRAAKSASYQVTVQGWRQANGDLWAPDLLVRMRSPFLGVDQNLLITDVSFSLDDSAGSTTELTLERPDAYKLDPTIQEKRDPIEADIIRARKTK